MQEHQIWGGGNANVYCRNWFITADCPLWHRPVCLWLKVWKKYKRRSCSVATFIIQVVVDACCFLLTYSPAAERRVRAYCSELCWLLSSTNISHLHFLLMLHCFSRCAKDTRLKQPSMRSSLAVYTQLWLWPFATVKKTCAVARDTCFGSDG